jgi:LPPG:FO 2-phospho-L-lactate transferase
MSDEPVRTILRTDQGDLAFQEYFVHRRCEPAVRGFEFRGAEAAAPAPGVMAALEAADVVVLCPSNPWVSIGPILGMHGIREAIQRKPCIAVSPIIGGAAVRGPAAKMYEELGIRPSALAVAEQYLGIAKGFVIDEVDSRLADSIARYEMWVLTTRTLMKTRQDRRRLAEDVLNFVGAKIP